MTIPTSPSFTTTAHKGHAPQRKVGKRLRGRRDASLVSITKSVLQCLAK